MAENSKVGDKAPEHKGVDVYMNISNVKLHTSMGVIWPRQEVMLQAKEAKTFGDKLVSRT